MAPPKASEPGREVPQAGTAPLPRRRYYFSLKARLRLAVILLVTLIVLALSILHLERVARISFEDVHDRATLVAEEAKNLIIHRVPEVAAQPAHRSRALSDLQRIWSDIIRDDQAIAEMLEQTMAASKLVVEILVKDQSAMILVSSRPDRAGEMARSLPVLPRWSETRIKDRLNLLWTRQDYVYPLHLGAQRPGGETLFTIEAVVSSVLVWNELKPQIVHIAAFNVVALALALLAAMLFSDIALRPLESISRAVDRISQGELPAATPGPRFRPTELADVHSKLNLLGQKFRGARQDAMELRINIERMLDRLKDAVLLFDADGRLLMASKSAEVLFDADLHGLTGRRLEEFFPATGKAGRAIREALERGEPIREKLVTLGHSDESPDSVEHSGELRVYLSAESLEISPRRYGMLITMRDAETRMVIQSQLDISTRLAAISRLTSGVAHEIKNPLNAMTLHFEVLRSKIDASDPEVTATLDVIRREVGRLDRVVKTFLDFTRPVELQMRPVDMPALLRDLSDLLIPQARKRGCDVLFRSKPSSIWLCGDPDMLNQALLNIMVNGIEAMDHSGTLDVGVMEKNGECVITISDQGPGIDPKIRDKIFNLYFTTKGSGSGIGLAIAFQVVQLHNGTIDFNSTPGQGTSFRLQFPVYDREPSLDSR